MVFHTFCISAECFYFALDHINVLNWYKHCVWGCALCVCIFVYVYKCVCVFACMYMVVYRCIFIHLYACMCLCLCVYLCEYISKFAYVCVVFASMCIFICLYVCTCTCICISFPRKYQSYTVEWASVFFTCISTSKRRVLLFSNSGAKKILERQIIAFNLSFTTGHP